MKLNRCSLNSVGFNRAGLNCVGIPSSSRSDKPTIDPALKAKLVGVWDCRGKTNEDADRGIIRDRTGKGNDLEILNAAYMGMSGYNGYAEPFNAAAWAKLVGVDRIESKITLNTDKDWSKAGWITYKTGGNVIASFKVKISGMPVGSDLRFSGVKMVDGINIIPSYTTTAATGFIINSLGQDWSKLVIEQIPVHPGAFVTDGVDDMIVSKKTVTEMIGDANEITVFSIIHQITGRANSSNPALTNYISNGTAFIRNSTSTIGKTGIYGYTIDVSSGTKSVISNILGDKNDYIIESNLASLSAVFSVCGKANGLELSQLAYRGGGMVIGKLTTDEINQVIASFDLDSFIEPDGWYDVAKQGITNENHATFNDKLIDFSPNKRDLVCNNFAWSGNSGIGKWATDFGRVSWTKYPNSTVYGQTFLYNEILNVNRFILSVPYNRNVAVPSFTVNVEFDNTLLYYYFETPETARKFFVCKQGINIIPASVAHTNQSLQGTVGFYISSVSSYAKIEQIPEQEGGLWHDGVDDNCISIDNFPAYKDFTVVADRYLEIGTMPGAAISKNGGVGAFVVDHNSIAYQSFGNIIPNSVPRAIRKLSYLSKYASLEVPTIVPGNMVDIAHHIATGTFRRVNSNFSKLGLYGFLVYPYSMNAFLIERQLKKLKFGTLYPKNE